ncbi:urease accessory protein UreD [uncultured Roseobacter sp.]|uniref:urease accessory protein UreD n=1 Tax=uncultured Roseobacter sp. TaxID=114847 RepID=UPI0026360364|nr:urease accessory protein UreD [uncultured Roseobacter sp.]
MSTLTPLDQPRAVGEARVSVRARDTRTVIGTLRQAGALKLLFPCNRQDVEAVLVNTAGGITGGDQFATTASAEQDTHLTITTQAAERAYRAQAAQTGQVRNRLQVADGATLHWLPQETILFEGAALTRDFQADLGTAAHFLMVEPLIFGRQAMGEDVRQLFFSDRIEVRRNNVPLWVDGLRFSGDVASQLDRPAIAGGARAMASVLWVHPAAGGALDFARQSAGKSGGASLLAPDVLLCRFLADDGYALRQALVPLLDHLTKDKLPRSWRL